MKYKIKEAAVIHKDIIYTGKRHWDAIKVAVEATGDMPINGIQGFVDMKGTFFTREASAVIAKYHKQIKELKYSNTQLFSEDLY